MSAVVAAFLFSLLTSAASASSVPLVDERLERLSDEHKSWLERDVVYIITERERDVFLTLESVDERDRFIEAFWRKRDPNRATPVNELRQEHYRRLDYANTYLGRETFREGWQTDRGRFYIILGEPREIQRFDGYNGVVSAHLWFYLLKPLEEMFSDRYEVMAGLGFALYLKDDFEPAADYLARARALAPPDTMLLNALGDSYQKLGKLDEAREAFERSLALDGEQAAVKARLAEAR